MASRYVLIVDDDPVMAKTLAFCTRKAASQVEVRCAADGQKGLDMARAEPPALVLLDVQLPVLRGTDVLRALRSASETRSVVVYMLSSTDDDAEIARLLDQGADGFIKKPVQVDQVIATLTGLLAS